MFFYSGAAPVPLAEPLTPSTLAAFLAHITVNTLRRIAVNVHCRLCVFAPLAFDQAGRAKILVGGQGLGHGPRRRSSGLAHAGYSTQGGKTHWCISSQCPMYVMSIYKYGDTAKRIYGATAHGEAEPLSEPRIALCVRYGDVLLRQCTFTAQRRMAGTPLFEPRTALSIRYVDALLRQCTFTALRRTVEPNPCPSLGLPWLAPA